MPTTVAKAVWTTASINDLPDSAFLYVEDGGTKDDSGKTEPRSLRHFPYRDSSGKVDLPHLRNALARIPQANIPAAKKESLTARAHELLQNTEKTEKAGRRMQGSMRDKLRMATSMIQEVMDWADQQGSEAGDSSEPNADMGEGMDSMMQKSTFLVFKDVDGVDRWVSFSTNAFEDREKEIVSTKAIEKNISEADETGDYGTLRLFHIKGTDIGRCDFQALEGRFLIESGVFDDTRLANKAKEYFLTTDEPLGVSIGFMHPISALIDGVYSEVKIFERSVCPQGDAANPWTTFMAIQKGATMDARKSAWLEKMLGPDDAKEIIGAAQTATKELEARVNFKATTETPTDFRVALATAIEAIPDETKRKAWQDSFEEEFPAETTQETQPTGDATAIIDGVKALLSPIATQIAELTERVKAVEAAPKEPTNIADHSPRGARLMRATEAQNNVVNADVVAKAVNGTDPEPSGDTSPAEPYLRDMIRAWSTSA